ncbi:MAG: hypothetical protein AVDCRST_MAG30-4201, partial [uncultured Solirubrobacteraceae bacterium]
RRRRGRPGARGSPRRRCRPGARRRAGDRPRGHRPRSRGGDGGRARSRGLRRGARRRSRAGGGSGRGRAVAGALRAAVRGALPRTDAGLGARGPQGTGRLRAGAARSGLPLPPRPRRADRPGAGRRRLGSRAADGALAHRGNLRPGGGL